MKYFLLTITISVICASNAVLAFQSFHGTTIVIIATKDSILVGADSRGAIEMHNGIIVDSLIVTKIHAFDNHGYAIAGLYGYQGSSYNPFSIGDSCFNRIDDLLMATRRFRSAIRRPIVSVWADMARSGVLGGEILNSKFTMYSFGFYRDSAYVFQTALEPEFIPTKETASSQIYTLTVKVDSTHTVVSGSLFFTGAFSDSLNKDFLHSFDSLISASPVLAIRKIIQTAIERDPLVNGPPIRIACVTRKRIYWIQ